MKILLLDVNCKYSSTGKLVYDLYRQLNSMGHTAGIGYGRGEIIQEPNICKFSPNWEVYAHALLTRIFGLTGGYSYIATKRLINFMKYFKPDVVHLNDMHGYFVNIIPLMEYLKKNDIKTIWTFHCEFMYTGKCGHAYECEQFMTSCVKCPHLRDYPESLFFDRTNRMFQDKQKAFLNFDNLIIVSPSEWLAKRIKKSFLRDKNIKVIYNGIDTKIFYKRDCVYLRKKLGITDEKVVLAVAPDLLSEQKGGKHVLQVAENMKNMNIKFILVGISDLNRSFGENIVPVGLIKDQELLAVYYSLADVFVICSKRENYPTTCVEAAACGTPIVGYNVGGTAETANPEEGIFVDYNNLKAIQNGIEYFLYHKEEAGNERKYTRDYSKEKMCRNYLKLYQNNILEIQ